MVEYFQTELVVAYGEKGDIRKHSSGVGLYWAPGTYHSWDLLVKRVRLLKETYPEYQWYVSVSQIELD